MYFHVIKHAVFTCDTNGTPPRMYNHADVRDDDSWTPLYNACYMGHKDVVQYLVEMANCDISEYNTAPK